MTTLPGRGERHYYDKLTTWLRVVHNEDGTIKEGVLDEIIPGVATQEELDLGLGEKADQAALTVVSDQLTAHEGDTANPHAVTATQVGLGNANNTSDANKPVSIAQQAALDLKADQSDLDTTNGTVSGHTTAIARVDPGDSPADTLIVRDDAGVSVSVDSPYVYAQARGFVPNSDDAGDQTTNATVLQAIFDEQKVAILPAGTHYYDTTLTPREGSGIKGPSRFLCTLVYSGSSDGMRAIRSEVASEHQGGIYRAIFEGFTLQFDGTGSGDGFRSNMFRYSRMRDVKITLFPGNGVYLSYVDSNTGSWSNRYEDCEFTQNGADGFRAENGSNANIFVACHASLNGRDGFNLDRGQGYAFPLSQAEANARHGITIAGVRSIDLNGFYIEHQDPGTFASQLQPPGYSIQSPRYGVYITRAADGSTRSMVVNATEMHVEGADNGSTITTNAAIYAEYCDHLWVGANAYFNVRSNRSVQIQSTCGPVASVPSSQNGNQDTLGNRLSYIQMWDFTASGPKPIDLRGPIGKDEGFVNLLHNGGFDYWPTTPGLPPGWTQNGAGTFSREAGADGGYRAVLTNTSSNQTSITQTPDGPLVAGMARLGKGVLVFDAIVPTTNSANTAHVRVIPKDSGGSTLGGGVQTAIALTKSNTEVTYIVPFLVPATTAKVEIRFYASNGTANTDVLKVDRVALYAGEIPKDYMPQLLERPITPAAYTPTNVTTDRAFDADTVLVAELADVVGTLIADLQAAKVIG